MALVLASTNITTARIAAGCLALALFIVLFVAKNWTLRGLCIGFIIFLAVVWILQEKTSVRILRNVLLFIGVMNSLFSVYGVYLLILPPFPFYQMAATGIKECKLDAEKFAEVCPCPCNGAGWGVIWGMISFAFLCGAMYLGLVILS
ncbi:hypothetical protein Pint_18762 [Pistacia integerrima]|uniref:Uncharacterized protein n=1 Tax=Pistacia integerrima TaxID=434235 RepID=A0ACC0YZJ4_9ROSI|nr:hypothetical protein Pint_18762 [Pistacia integerrima]